MPRTPGSVRKSPRKTDKTGSTATESPADTSETGSTNTKASQSIQEVRLVLERHGMYVGNMSIFEENEAIFKAVRSIVYADRSSEMKPESIQKFIDAGERWVTANEAALIMYLRPILLKDYRTVKANKPIQLENDPANAEYVLQSWDKDYMDINLDVAFKCPAKPSGLKIPKPDQIYGLHWSAFDAHAKKVNERYSDLAGISSRIWHPFLLFEWKSAAGSMPDAQNQACRGGSAVVNANRELRSIAGTLTDDAEGPDTKSFIFSCTITPDLAQIWVHWYLDGGDSPAHHMSKVSNHALDDREQIKLLRRNLDNILDWGVLIRADEVKTLLATIYKNDPGSFNENSSPSKKSKRPRPK